MIDVIIPSYNDYRILNTINSIKYYESKHSISFFTLIIIDGGSELNLLFKIRNIISQNDFLLTEKDKGIFDALNKGLDVSVNKFIWWLGSDDLLNVNIPVNIFNFLSTYSQHDCYNFKTCYFNSNRITRSSSIYNYSNIHYKLGIDLSHFSTIWKKSFIAGNRFNLKYNNSSDLDFFYTLIVENKAKIKNFNYTLTFMSEGGKTSKNLKARLINYFEICKIYKLKYNKYLFVIPVLLRIIFKLSTTLKWNITPIDKKDFIGMKKYIH